MPHVRLLPDIAALIRATKEKRKAERRKALFRNRHILRCGARLAARSPLGVPPRHLRQRPNATAQLEPRDFLGTRSERPPRWFERRSASQHTTRSQQNRLPCVTRGRYPRLAVPVQRDCTRSPVMMPSGRVLPKPPESQGDEPRPAGTALAPPDGVTRPASWYVSEIRSSCTAIEDGLSRDGRCIGDRKASRPA